MILTVHLLTGAALAVKMQNPLLGGILAFFSHYFLDALPHREYSIKNFLNRDGNKIKSRVNFLKIILDFSFGVLLIFIFSKNLIPTLSGGLLGVAADGLTLLFFLFPSSLILKKHHHFHRYKVHFFTNKKIPLFWEIFSQILVSFIAIFFLLL